jgi:hypothetical protein
MVRLTELKEMKNERFSFDFYSMTTQTNYGNLFNDINDLISQTILQYPELLIEESPSSSSSSPTVQETQNNVETFAVAAAASTPEPQPQSQPAVKKVKKLVKKVIAAPAAPSQAQAAPATPSKKFINASMRMRLDELIQLCQQNHITIKVSKKKEILEQIKEHNDSIIDTIAATA